MSAYDFLMRRSHKYALDCLFLFMLFVSIAVFGLAWAFHIDETIIHAVEYIDFTILGGYYIFFFDGLVRSSKKLQYVKNHWVMLVLLILPFIPMARLLPASSTKRALDVGSKTLWHFLDELQLL